MKRKHRIARRIGPAGRNRKLSSTADILGGLRDRSGRKNGQYSRGKWSRHYRHLLSLRAELLKQSAELALEGAREMPHDQLHPADTATDSFERDFALSILSSDQEALYEIDEALRRIEGGTYGICEVTGKPISSRRLEVIPWTRFSVEAARQLERTGALARAHVGAAMNLAGEPSFDAEVADESEEPAGHPAG